MASSPGTYWNLHKIPLLLIVLGLITCLYFGYALVRTDTLPVFATYGILFFIAFKLIQFRKWNFKLLLAAGLLFRLAFLLATPNLSEDFYRFLWDGSLTLDGINPYAFTPEELGEGSQFRKGIFDGISDLSKGLHSNYPPLNQLFFALGLALGGKSVTGALIAFRGIHILADLGIVFFGRKLLKQLNLSPHLIFWYFLNPLVIIELTGNLHFEGVMLFFFTWALYLVHSGKWLWSALLFGLAVSTKLIPLIFLPLFLPYLGWRKSAGYYAVTFLATGVTVIPFLTPDLVQNYSATLSLWFSNFEFNASVYNLVEYIGVQADAKPWELIKVYGKIIGIAIVVFLMFLTFLRRPRTTSSLILMMLYALTFFYLLSATVHPWYIIFLVLLCLFGEYRYPLFWSAVVIFSYAAYSNPEYKEEPVYLIIEYSLVYVVMLYEFYSLNREKAKNHKNDAEN